MTNENAFTSLQALALPFLLVALALLWLNDQTFGRLNQEFNGWPRDA